VHKMVSPGTKTLKHPKQVLGNKGLRSRVINCRNSFFKVMVFHFKKGASTVEWEP
jgi:hypothetical protein